MPKIAAVGFNDDDLCQGFVSLFKSNAMQELHKHKGHSDPMQTMMRLQKDPRCRITLYCFFQTCLESVKSSCVRVLYSICVVHRWNRC